MPLRKAGEDKVGREVCRRQGILEQGKRDVYGETTEDKAGDGPGCLGHDEAEKDQTPHLSYEALEV